MASPAPCGGKQEAIRLLGRSTHINDYWVHNWPIELPRMDGPT